MGKVLCKGIDVSHWQGDVDFTKVKNSGYDFVILNAGYGKYINQKDPYFEQNYKNAKVAGLKIGAYWYAYATSVADAKAEAQVFMQAVASKRFDLPLFYDVEDECQTGLASETIGQMIDTFCGYVESQGYKTGLYSFRSFLNSHVPTAQQKKWDVWLAEFDVASPAYQGDYTIWQYTSTGRVGGVNGNCDCNYLYKNYFDAKPTTKTTPLLSPFDKYFDERIGVGLDYDGQYGIMCFDLANDYSVNLIGGKQFLGMGAYEIYTNFDNQPAHELYTKIPNTPEFVPAKGDIMVWSTGIGQWGHVAICTGEGDTTWFESYDQNWNYANAPVTLVKHSYNSVLGVLRPKDQTKIWGYKGDVDGNGKIDVSDISKLSAHIKGIKAIDEKYIFNADVNGDGKIDVSDIATVSAHIKGVKPIKQGGADTKPVAETKKKEQVYVVQKGDTLSGIAARYNTTYTKIAADNKISNPNLIYPGQKLVIK